MSISSGTFTGRGLLVVAGTVIAVLVAGCSSSTSSAAPTTGSTASIAAGALVGTANTSVGTVLVDSGGKVIYTFSTDTVGQSSCVGSCVTYWPPVPAPSATPAPVSGITATLGSIKRADGTLQLTVNGLPVYTYAADSGPGVASGQGLNSSGGIWSVVNTAGAPVTAAPSASKSSSGGGWA